MFDVTPKTSPKQLDCGPTCLQMLLDYYGISVELDTLIEQCNVGLRGSTAADLRRVGNNYGLDILVWDDSNNVDVLINQDRPAIIWWKYNHFCVFCGKDTNGDIVICNPDRGRYSLSLGSFKAFFSGVSLTNGTPEELQESDQETVVLSKYEYDDIMDVINKGEEVFG